MPDAEVYLLKEFLSGPAAEALFAVLEAKAAWKQEKIKLFGKQIDQPRLTVWYADAGKAYTYSGLTWEPLPWLPELSEVRKNLESLTGTFFNSVLLNLYRHGQDSMGWHSDDEPELGQNPTIASLTLGQERSFHFRHRTQPELKHKLILPSGSLLLMASETQHHWQHQVPKSAKPLEPRINLTFRFIE
ncbi:2OG-Fe(II) oxygenase [Rufibacter radiotolerans]|uniref:2OG-Fe(II) oxygenase n=2 Tax=Rufibacter radiotolerans TaxID=1379910 RepID=A0A0H4VVA2_9BACT|nr:2OG-Fe(II) oxygenase [Rufibacter radiotolerans]